MKRHEKECNVVLVSLYRNQNFAIRILHSVLKQIDSINIHSIFFKESWANLATKPTIIEERLFTQKIIDLKPTVVCISVLSSYVPIAKMLTTIIRDNSSSLVVWGGVHPTICPEPCIKEADIVCRGEGEGALVDLITCLKEGREYLDIKNLWINDKGNIIKNPMRPLIQNLDNIPFPSYGSDLFFFIDNDKITRSDPMLLDDRLEILSSRGCPFACPYCVNSIMKSLFKDLGSYTRTRSVRNVIDEIRQQLILAGDNKKAVEFQEEVFAWNKNWVDEFASLYTKEIGMPFHICYNPKVVDPEVFSKLVSAGLAGVTIGIQTGSDSIRNNILNRHEKNSEIIKIDKLIIGSGVRATYDLIADNPYETDETLKDGIYFLLQLTKPLYFNYFSLQYFPNYVLTQKAINDGYIGPDDLTEERLFEKSTQSWMYDPKLFPYTKKTMLQNIIWLIVWNYTKDPIVKRAISDNSPIAKICLLYLNLKAIFLGKIFGKGGIKRKLLLMYLKTKRRGT